MDFDDFVGQVMNDLEMGRKAHGVRAVRATLNTLSERLQEGEATDLAGALPMEIDHYVLMAEHGQKFDVNDFITRVADIEDISNSEAKFHIQVVIKIMTEAIPAGETEDILDNLPEEYEELFSLSDY